MKQQSLFEKSESRYGGDLRKKNRGARPLSTRSSLHLILKSSQAAGPWAFNHPRNRPIVDRLLRSFADRFGVAILSVGNAGDHVHVHLRLANRYLYGRFIRGLCSALVTAITGHSRWNKVLAKPFFDRRPFTRVVAEGRRSFQGVEDYTAINHWQGVGVARAQAEGFVRYCRERKVSPRPREPKPRAATPLLLPGLG